MYIIKVDLWKNNKYGNSDETHYVGEYLTKNAAETDAIELDKRLIFSGGYKRIKLEIVDR